MDEEFERHLIAIEAENLRHESALRRILHADVPDPDYADVMRAIDTWATSADRGCADDPDAWTADRVFEIPCGSSYGNEISVLRFAIGRIVGLDHDEPVIHRVLDKFTVFFSGMQGNDGLWLANNFHRLIQRIDALPQAEFRDFETRQFRTLSFLNMGVSLRTVRDFAKFLRAGWGVLERGVYTAENPMTWSEGLRPVIVDELKM